MIDRHELASSTVADWRLESANLGEALARLEQRFGPIDRQIHAFVPEAGRFERLRRAAERLGRETPEAARRGPLWGVPIGVKDIFHVAGLTTRAGTRLPPEVLQGPEAECVRRLKDAGCLVLGKTVTTEFAYFAPGPTRNPHDLERTPGGSSSGSAAAVAAGLCPLALGTQTIGSISRPASFCGVVGYKPSYGRISAAGVIPLSASLDHVGTFSASVADTERAAALLCESWRPEKASQRPILGLPEGPYLERASSQAQVHFRRACSRLASAAFELRSVPTFRDFEEIEARHRLIVAAEAAQVHRDWYSEFRDLYDARTRELVEAGLRVSDEELAAARAGRRRLRNELTGLMERHGVDLWLSPAAPGPAPRGLDSTGDPVMNLPWTQAGLPTLSLPAGRIAPGLPMGLQLTAGWRRDEALLAWALELEEILSAND